MPENRLELEIAARDEQFRQAMERVRATAVETGKALEGAIEGAGDGFDGAGEAAREMGRQAELALEAVAQEAADLKGQLAKAFEDGKYESIQLRAALDKLDQALAEVGEDGKRNGQKIEDALREVKAASQQAAQGTEELSSSLKGLELSELADKAGQLADSLSGLSASFSEAGAGVRETEIALKRTFTDPGDVAKYTAQVQALKASFEGLQADEAVEGIQNLERFKVLSEQNLNRVASIAKVTGKSIGELSEPFGEFLAKAENGGDFGAFQELGKIIGVGAKELEKFGALTKDGELLGDTPEQIKRAQDALLKYIDSTSRFSDVSKRSQDEVSLLNAEITKFQDSVGTGTNKLKAAVAEGILPFATALNGLSDKQKASIGIAAAGVSGLAQFGAKALELAAFVKLSGLSITGMSTAIQGAGASIAAFATGTGGLVLVGAAAVASFVALAKSIYDYKVALKDAEAAQQSLLDTQRQALASDNDRRRLSQESVDNIRAEADAIEDAGKRRALISDAIIGKEARAGLEREKGNAKLAGQLEAEATLLKASRAGYDDRAASAVRAAEAATEGSKKAYAEDAKAAEEAAKKKAEDTARSADARLKTEQRLAAESAALQKSSLALDARDLASADAKIEGLKASLDAGKDVTKELERELAARAENQKRLLEQEAALERIGIKQKANADAAEIPDKDLRTKVYENAAERQSQLDRKLAQDKAAVDRQLAKDQEGVAAKQAANAKKAADEKAAADAKSLALEAKKADLALQTYEQQRAAQQATFDEKRQQLEQEVSLGQDRSRELAKLDADQAKATKTAIAEQAKLQVEAITKRAEAEKQGKSSEEQSLIAAQAKLDIEKALLVAKQDTKAIVDQSLVLQQQQLQNDLQILQALKDQNAERDKAKGGFDLGSTFAPGGQSVADAFGTNASGLGVSRAKREGNVAPDGRTQAEVERDIARQQGILNSQQTAANRGDASGGSTFGVPRARTVGGQRDQISDTPGAPAFDASAMVTEAQKTNELLAQLVGNGGANKLNDGWEGLLGRSRGGPNLPGLT